LYFHPIIYSFSKKEIGMKKIFFIVLIAVIGFAGMSIISCDNGSTSGLTVVNKATIEGITAPVNGGTPVTVITDNAQYSGTVLWTPSDVTFQPNKAYYATITLTEKKAILWKV
jgi:hypothetical protein